MIVGIGELLWDLYPDGRKVAGGAPFNFAFHCRQLGHESAIVSRVGNDDLGRELRDCVQKMGVRDDWIQTDPVHPTGTVQVTLDANKVPTYTITKNVAWDYIEWRPALDGLAATRSPRNGVRKTDEVEAVCFGTLAQRSKDSRDSIETLVFALNLSAIRVFDLNLRGPIDSRLPLQAMPAMFDSTWVKVNDQEMKRLAAEYSMTAEDVMQFYFSQSRGKMNLWIITKGEAGVDLVQDSGGEIHLSAVPAKVVDTVGAGDAFTAAMVCLHLEGRPLKDCARFANHYAARVCEHQGATPVIDRAEAERAAFGSP